MKVLKFGGSSVANAENILKVSRIVEQKAQKSRLLIVASAFGGTTDQLIQAGESAQRGDSKYTGLLQNIEFRHLKAIDQLIPFVKQSHVKGQVKLLLNQLEDVCNGIFLLRELSPKTKDYLLSFGERLSAYILSETLKEKEVKVGFMDSRELIITDDQFGNARVDFELTNNNIQEALKHNEDHLVFPGFIASSIDGYTTTLGRGGSDYTAAILASALHVKGLEIWTDVSGIMTSDPRLVDFAYPIKYISYEEAMELSHFGAKVIYPPTLHPVLKKRIPISIKNTFAPEDTGTLISEHSGENGQIKGISSISGIALLTLSGSGMVGIPGISMRLFSSLSAYKVNVVFITQASSEHSITVGIALEDVKKAEKALDEEFAFELSLSKVDKVAIEEELSIVALVGDKMRDQVGLSGRALYALGKNGINIRAIAQGSTERNISLVVAEKDVRKALNILHETFFLSETKKVHLFMVGVGNVGGALLEQLCEQSDYLKTEHGIELKVVGISNSRKMLVNEEGVNLSVWKEELANASEAADLTDFIERMKNCNLRNSILVDNTASEVVSNLYDKVLGASISVVTSNKIAASSSYQNYRKLKELAKHKNTRLLYETNVGAGLPVINTIHDLVKSGDRIHKIQAVLSGSLNFIFNTFSEEISFAKAVKMAQEGGYTEPDPRIDLSGVDVMRKILILAREGGAQMNMEQINNESFMPDSCLKTENVEEFFNELEKHQSAFEEIRMEAESKGMRLKYIAEFENGKAKVGLQKVTSDHPFYHLDGKDNIVLLTTSRYQEQPLVVKGAGAGAAVTAAGVFADIMRIAN
ncbi:bifunctional aspartate kinase/homoserine dehydrogenase I [Xanthovirga aplysinae]|uniref:bifunctional aspartate kinase/homoserine dehydrogenase I n=1 Tax=Xanthovirga aplysinae TaxID=2529853 RepID=UPI0012BC138D|nr:bifunctional aspartate kinase/homoserine dehydrogenase I [Xanthovirga aplysinae]MTI32513.1 bifunctional aspartate kinase/homoserine dehydrogenase I [Xanthovirga aplysinae]